MEFLDFDDVLSIIYDDDSCIDPLNYLASHFDILRNQVDLYALKNNIPAEQHLDLIQIVKDHEDECIQNVRNDFSVFQKELNFFIERKIELSKENPRFC